jgi:hypothetical protein
LFIKERYPVNWLTTIRPAALRAAGYKCVNCRVPDRAIGYRDNSGTFIECDEFMRAWCATNKQKVFKIILTISHTNHDTTDNRLSNLKALCQKCHLQHDKGYHTIMRQAKLNKTLPPPFSSLLLP